MRHVSALGWRRRRKKYGRYQDGHFTGLIRSAFHVHSGCFESIGRLCIEGECLRWCGAVMAMIYRAPWKSHECPTGDLSIPEVEPYLCDENKIAPTQISSLYAFLTLAHKPWKHTTIWNDFWEMNFNHYCPGDYTWSGMMLKWWK